MYVQLNEIVEKGIHKFDLFFMTDCKTQNKKLNFFQYGFETT